MPTSGPKILLSIRHHFFVLSVLLAVSWMFSLHGGSVVAEGRDEISLGTTLIALKYDGGVVLGADSRTSRSVMVSNRFAKKINVVVNNENGTTCAICRSGSAADTQYVAKAAKESFRTRHWCYRFHHPTVSQVAHFLRSTMRSSGSSNQGLKASLICAGCDDSGGRIFSIAIDGGAMLEDDVFCVSGSGSTFLLGYLDALKLDPLALYSKDKAVDLVVKLLTISIARDGASGGLIRVMVLNRAGVEEQTRYPIAEVEGSPSEGKFLAGFANLQ